MEQEKKEWLQENEKFIKRINDLEDEAVLKNAKLLELGNLFLIPQVEMKSIFLYNVYIFLITFVTKFVTVLGNKFKSLRPTIQVNNLDNHINEEIHKENSFLKNKIEELQQEIGRLKKNTKHMTNQVHN